MLKSTSFNHVSYVFQEPLKEIATQSSFVPILRNASVSLKRLPIDTSPFKRIRDFIVD